MSKNKTQYQCSECGEITSKWLGQCQGCDKWNSITAIEIQQNKWAKSSDIQKLIEVAADSISTRQSSGIIELDRVLGGGMTEGSCILLGGDPGIGKSTLLLQMLGTIKNSLRSLYVSGEESASQLGMRARRLGLTEENCYVLSETNLEKILKAMNKIHPNIVIIDSIQTLYDENINSACGSIAQIRDCTHQLINFCKSHNITIFIIGHVTKEGALAGPRVLEHMVDTVLYFEGDRSSRYRLIRAIKNRFGPSNELGIFAMTQEGLKDITNPSRIFLQDGPMTPGRVITAIWEGSRAMLIEIQVLISPSYGDHPRRVTVGFDYGRLNMLLAVATRALKIKLHEFDVFVNVVGGIKITETAADLALIAALLSSHKDIALDRNLMVFGEVGLSGEVRPINEGQVRIQSACKQGFKTIWVPNRNNHQNPSIRSISHIQELKTLI